MSPFYVCLNVTFFAQAKRYCQTRVPGLTYRMRMVKHLTEKLKSHRESQKGTRADAIIQIHPPPPPPPPPQ